MPKNLPEIPERCGYNECVPDITGYCVFCRHELVREVDDHGIPMDAYPNNIADTCCGKCPGNTCYVDQITGA